MKKVKKTTRENKAPAPSQVEEQPKLPEKKTGPQMSPRSPDDETLSQPGAMPSAVRASEMLASPESELGTSIRARMGSMLQRQVGNARVGRALDAAVQAKRTVTAPNDVHEQEADQVAGEIGKRPAATMIQRHPADGSASTTPAASTPASGLDLTPQDAMVTASLLQTLERFRNIPIDVGSKKVHVHAQYFNNKFNRLTKYKRYKTARKKQKFSDVIDDLHDRGVMSVLEGEKKRRSSGRAVEVGKASPEDIKAFVEEAIAQGTIERYAIASRKLEKGKQLVTLPTDVLQALIQSWMRETGVGLDCNGFVQQALIQVREEERAMTSLINSITGAFGLPDLPMPEEIERADISVGGFKTNEIVKKPTELRPGDAWVMTGPNLNHIRIVTRVSEVVWKGKPTIEFDTAESTPPRGPIARTWHTSSMKKIGLGGAFYHTLSSDKLTRK